MLRERCILQPAAYFRLVVASRGRAPRDLRRGGRFLLFSCLASERGSKHGAAKRVRQCVSRWERRACHFCIVKPSGLSMISRVAARIYTSIRCVGMDRESTRDRSGLIPRAIWDKRGSAGPAEVRLSLREITRA